MKKINVVRRLGVQVASVVALVAGIALGATTPVVVMLVVGTVAGVLIPVMN